MWIVIGLYLLGWLQSVAGLRCRPPSPGPSLSFCFLLADITSSTAAQQQNYALYQQGIPPSVATPTSHFPQPPKTFSPPNRASPNATPTKPHQAQNNESVPNTPMAAKTTVQPGQPTPQSAVRSVPQSPVSSEAQTQEKERVTLLLEINAELLQEITSLQTQGKGGYTGVPPQGSAEAGKPPEMKPASKEYIEYVCIRGVDCSENATNAT